MLGKPKNTDSCNEFGPLVGWHQPKQIINRITGFLGFTAKMCTVFYPKDTVIRQIQNSPPDEQQNQHWRLEISPSFLRERE